MRPPLLNALTRRDLLRSAIAAGVSLILPGTLSAAPTTPAAPTSRRLVLLELEGGNDGLNTLVPLAPVSQYYNTYFTKRPTIRLASGLLLPLNTTSSSGTLVTDGSTGFGLSPHLTELTDAWYGQDLAFALGVGYPNPNRSHFRGIDIVHSSQEGADSPVPTGWMHDLFTSAANSGAVSGLKGHGIILEHYSDTPFRGGGAKDLAVQSAQNFVDRASGITAISATTGANASLAHIKTTIANILSGQSEISKALRSPGSPVGTFDEDENRATWDAYWTAHGVSWFGNNSSFVERQCRSVAEIIVSGVEIPVFRITLGGFDNHSDQIGKHTDLLQQVGRGLARLRSALMAVGGNYWDDTLIMSYSEFGRRIEQNNSGGTDHGTAAPHFVLGGAVNGRQFFGTQPMLNAPDSRGDLIATMDYRRLYRSACDWLGLTAPSSVSGFTAVPSLYTA